VHYQNPVFSEATVDTEIVIFKNCKPTENHKIRIDIFDRQNIKTEQQIAQQSWIDANGAPINVFINENEKLLFEKIKNCSKLVGEISKVYSGITLFEKGAGTPPQTKTTMKEKPYIAENKPKSESKFWKPLMRGSLMNRYVNIWNNNYWVKYGEWLAAPRNPKIFEAEEKIIVRQTGDSIIATIIGKNIICRKNLHILISENVSHKFILGILNSRLTDFYYQQINPERGEALAEVKKGHVEQLPIPAVSPAVQRPIIDLADEILRLKSANPQADTAALERQIDTLVYELYGLTEEEIKIVEGEK
jgi:hypothetical protein